MSTQWHYVQNGASAGPVPEEQLKVMIATGALKPTDLVWREGMAQWTAVQALPELQAQAPVPAPASAPVPVPAVAPAANPYTAPQAAVQGPAPEAPAAGPVSQEAVEMLARTKPWVRFFGILGLIGIVLMVLGAVAMGLLSAGPFRYMGLFARLGVGVLYLVLALLYIPPVLYLNRYASRIRDLMDDPSSFNLEQALKAQKSFWKYIGVFTVVFMCIYALALIGVLVAALAMGSGRLF